ncbi:MAG: zinc-finger domain-containing protein [Rhodospirillaceae bacterium]|nr:MAG: zinc-finger domain-containing protein [Rhodospirillaceae bacterium]
MADQDVQIVSSTKISCNGNGTGSGHPNVYLTLDAHTHEITCPYCSQKFKLDPNAKVSAGH